MTPAPHDVTATAQATIAVVLLTDQIQAGHPDREMVDGGTGIGSGNRKKMEGTVVVVIRATVDRIGARVGETGRDPMVKRREKVRELRIGRDMTMMSGERCVLFVRISGVI